MHRIAALTLWMSLIFTSIVAFQVFVAADEAQPAGTQHAFNIVSVEAASKDAAIDAIAATAGELGFNIFKVQPADPHGSEQGRTLFAFVGDSDTFESNGGYDYPEFSAQALTTHVVPADTLTTQDLRGLYVTDAGPGQTAAMLARLSEAGITARDSTVGGMVLLVYSVGKGNLAGSFAVMAIALGLAISYSVARNRKVYALRALHGYRRISSVRAEVVSCTATFGVGVAGLLVVGVPLLGVYNQFRQALGFLQVFALTIVVLYVVVIALVVLAVLSLPRASTPVVLKGERASLRNGVLAAVAQVAVLAIVLATTSAAMNRVEAVKDSLAVSTYWSEGDALYALRLSATGTHADDMRDAPGLGAVIADLERADQVLLVGFKGDVGDDAGAPTDPEGSDSMFVNGQYLERQVVRDADGRRIADLPEGKDGFTLLVPRSYDGDPQALLERYVAYFKDFACDVGREDDSFSCDPQGKIAFTESGQDLFTYSGTAFLPAEMQTQMFVHDPVIAVVPAVSELISPMEYLSYSSRDDVFFSDPAALGDALDAQGIRGNFRGIDNAADAVTTSVALAQRELTMDAFGLALGWAVLVLSSAVMIAVYCDRRKRPMFVELIHGYSFVRRHWRYLAGAAVLSVLGIGLAGLAGGSLARGREVAVATAFLTAQMVISLVAIRIYETRFRADFIKRY